MRCFVMAAALALAGCASACPQGLAPPCPSAPLTPQPSTCAGYCARIAQLGCPAAKATPEGALCVAVCENMQATPWAAMDLACRTKAASCGEVDKCR